MKKLLIISSVIIMILCINKPTTIPKESIRFRVIANSDSIEDQTLKKEIVKNLSKELIKTDDINNIEDTRKYLQSNLPLYTEIVDKTLKSNKSNRDFHINYGKNYFPEKTYNNEIYPEGEYESLVITLGEGEGDNFWCVLFPPLCFPEKEDYHYKSFIKEIFDKIFE